MQIRSNLLRDVKTFYLEKLSKLYGGGKEGEREVIALFNWAVEEILSKKAVDIALEPDFRLTESQILSFLNMYKRLSKFEPIQYIFSKAYFDGNILEVSPSVLIPRPETEELVSIVYSDILAKATKLKRPIKILDLCTGSGAIGISLAIRLQNQGIEHRIVATDISEAALELAEKNAKTLCVKNIAFVKHDILQASHIETNDESWSIIISNPPYVRESEKTLMNKNVLNHEPHLALFVSDSAPLLFYKSIARYAASHLETNSCVYLEINEALAKETATAFAGQNFTDIKPLKDFRDKYRFLKILRNPSF